MKKIYNFFLDIDGTILAHGKHEVSAAVIDALKYARSMGSKVFINTGRTKGFMPDFLKNAEYVDGLCYGCGTYVEINGRPIFQRYLTREQIERVADKFIMLGLDSDLLFEGSNKMYYIGQNTDWQRECGFIPINGSDFFKDPKLDPKVNKFSIRSNLEKRKEFFDSFSDEFYTTILPNYCESVPIGCDKGTAIQIVEQSLGLDPALSVAIGDSMNDAAMLEYAATAVAMGNASDEVKAMCDIITDTVDNDGVASVIYKLSNGK